MMGATNSIEGCMPLHRGGLSAALSSLHRTVTIHPHLLLGEAKRSNTHGG